MALGTGLSGTGGSHDLYVPEVWSKRIQSAFERNTVAKERGMDMSALLSESGGDILRVPRLGNRTATTRALTSFDEVTPTAPTETQFTMNVQTWAIDDEFISDALSAQTKIFNMGQLDGKMQRSLAEKFDTDMWANYTAITATLGDNTGASDVSPDDIFDALERLDSNFAPKSDRCIVLSPKAYWAMVKSNVIPSGDYSSEKSKETGALPRIGGVEVIMSQNLPAHANGGRVNLVLHKECLAYAIAKPASVMNEHFAARRGTIVGGDMIYGTGCYRAAAGVVLFGK